MNPANPSNTPIKTKKTPSNTNKINKETTKEANIICGLKAGALCVTPTKSPSTPTILGEGKHQSVLSYSPKVVFPCSL
jgi:hypothetical protein